MAANLTSGAIMMICRDDFSCDDIKPVLQVIDLKLVQTSEGNKTKWYSLVLSDGSHFKQGMFATQMNELVHAGRLQKGSVVKLTQFLCNFVQNRQIIIVIELDMILDKCDPIGAPVPAPRDGPGAAQRADQTEATPGNPSSDPPARGSTPQSEIQFTIKQEIKGSLVLTSGE